MGASRWWFTASFLLLAAPAGAQDVASGPAPGEKVSPLKVFDATGLHKDQEIDYAAERKEQPTIYVLIQADRWDRPMARFLKKLDEVVKQDSDAAYVVAVWLTEDPEKTKAYLPRVQQSVSFEATALTCFPGDKAGPKGWDVNPDAHLTAVVANKGQVAARFGYRSLNETNVPAVREALQKAHAAP